MVQSPRLSQLSTAPYVLPPEWEARLHSPSLILYSDPMRANVRQMLDYCGGDANRWRPHLKTTKSPRVWRELLDAGVRNFKCATTREAQTFLELVAAMGVEGADLLVAYPLLAPNLDALCALARSHPTVRVSILSEDPEHARALPPELGVFVDINPDMNRTGIPVAEFGRILAVAQAAGDRLIGLHFYDGHIRDAEQATRERRVWAGLDRLLAVDAGLLDRGIRVREWVTSGTPAFPYALTHSGLRSAREGVLHRISPGTVVFHDAFSDDLLSDVTLRPAALLFTRVISHPAPGMVTCDAGSKSLAAEVGDPAAFVLGHPELIAQRPSEEHLPLRVEPGSPIPAAGTPLLLVPRHVCPTVNLAESALFIESGRDPVVVPITARAHDLLATNS